jgi:hypothetical protein
MTLVKQLKELLPECEVMARDYRTAKFRDVLILNYSIEVCVNQHWLIRLGMSVKLEEKDELTKNTLPYLHLCSDDHDFISEFDFNALSEFIKAHTGEWTSISNII